MVCRINVHNSSLLLRLYVFGMLLQVGLFSVHGSVHAEDTPNFEDWCQKFQAIELHPEIDVFSPDNLVAPFGVEKVLFSGVRGVLLPYLVQDYEKEVLAPFKAGFECAAEAMGLQYTYTEDLTEMTFWIGFYVDAYQGDGPLLTSPTWAWPQAKFLSRDEVPGDYTNEPGITYPNGITETYVVCVGKQCFPRSEGIELKLSRLDSKRKPANTRFYGKVLSTSKSAQTTIFVTTFGRFNGPIRDEDFEIPVLAPQEAFNLMALSVVASIAKNLNPDFVVRQMPNLELQGGSKTMREW